MQSINYSEESIMDDYGSLSCRARERERFKFDGIFVTTVSIASDVSLDKQFERVATQLAHDRSDVFMNAADIDEHA